MTEHDVSHVAVLNVNTAMRDVFYLARVGAYRYLDAAAALLVRDGVPGDGGLAECRRKCCDPSSDKPQRGPGMHPHGKGALTEYAKTERKLLTALDGLDDEERKLVSARMDEGLAEGERLRANLLRKGHPVPGRGRWMVEES